MCWRLCLKPGFKQSQALFAVPESSRILREQLREGSIFSMSFHSIAIKSHFEYRLLVVARKIASDVLVVCSKV